MRIAIICCLLFASTRLAIADGLVLDGLGARSGGRGGTNLAWADSGTILHDNPAGVVNFQGATLVQADVGLLVVDSDYQDPGGVGKFDTNPVPLGNISLLKKLNRDVAVGLGLFTVGGFATDWDMPGQVPFAGDRNYKSFGAFAKILPGLSVRLTDQLSVGGTLGVAIDHTELEGPYTLQSGFLRGTPTLMDLQGTGAALTWSVGLQYQLSPQTTIGAAYKSASRFELDGTVTTEIPGIGVSSFDADINITWPRTVGVGVRHKFCEHKIGSIDLIYYNWQKAYDTVGMTLSNATNPVVATFGDLDEQFPLNWRDTISVRVGFERVLARNNRLRLGYVYHRNPIPAATLTPYIVPIMEHTLTAGYGTRTQNWEIDYGYQLMFGGTQRVGTSDFVGGDFDNSEIETVAHVLFVGLQRRQ